MSRLPELRRLQGRAWRRQIALALVWALPWWLTAGAGQVFVDHRTGAVLAWLVGAALLAWQGYRLRLLGARWLIRQLNDRRPDLEDSAGLLLADPAALPMLAQWQRRRVLQRLQAAPLPDLRPAWPLGYLLGNAGLASGLLLAGVLWPSARLPTPAVDAPASDHRADGPTVLLQQSLRVIPPRYTGLPESVEVLPSESIEPAPPPSIEPAPPLRVPTGSELHWALQFKPQPSAAVLVFHDGREWPLQFDQGQWRASRTLDKSAAYRIRVTGVPALHARALQRIEVIPDAPPQLRVRVPDRSLSLAEPGQHHWPLEFEASDDYGLGPAQLQITHTQGSGEVVEVRTKTLTLRGTGDRRSRHYAWQADLSAEGFKEGDDLIARLTVADNRQPQAQSTRSASLILRWPPAAGAQAEGLEGVVKRTLPAYFRSQRQIIIDSEALLAERPKLAAARYLARADAIGVDQRILRLRYGEFLGEETGGEPQRPDVAADAKPGTGAHDDHDAPTDVAAKATGDAAAIVEAFGHSHDHAEATTLLDPQTRALLKQALGEMWQAELHLRQGRPDAALPFEYRALGFIKQVQQASRIYLARVGLELPPIDLGRRLGGDRTGLRSRPDQLPAAERSGSPADALWLRLAPGTLSAPGVAADLDALTGWLPAHEDALADPLSLYAAVAALRADPTCTPCAQTLRALLWPLLSRSAAQVPARPAGNRMGEAYLDALQSERSR